MGATHVGDPELEVALVVAVLLLRVAPQVAEATLVDLLEARGVPTGCDGLLGPFDIAADHTRAAV